MVARKASTTCQITATNLCGHAYPFHQHFFALPPAQRVLHMLPELAKLMDDWGTNPSHCAAWLHKLGGCLAPTHMNLHAPHGAERFFHPLSNHCMVASKAMIRRTPGLSTNTTGPAGYVHMCMGSRSARCYAHRFVLWCTFGPPTMLPQTAPTDIRLLYPRAPSRWVQMQFGWAVPREVDGSAAMAMHSCNVSMCLNPLHLYWGYAKENHHSHVDGTKDLQNARNVLFSKTVIPLPQEAVEPEE